MPPQSAAIITGAGSGIGRATAERLAAAGWAVVLAGRTESKLRQTADRIIEQSGEDHPVLIHPADLSDPAPCEALIAAAEDRFGRIDALVHAAGFATVAPISETTPNLWRTILDSNLSAAAYLTHAVWPTLTRQRSGVIVNVSSMSAIDPFPGFAAYASAKAAVNMLTRVTADEGAAINVRAVAIAPGAVETPLLRSMFNEQTIPPDQCLPPDAIAALIFDCITGRRTFDPGEVITITE